MSDVIEAALAALAEKDISGFEGIAKFVIQDEGMIMLDGDGARAGDEAADVTLTADADTFQGILGGTMDPTSAFMSGKLSVDGDMSMAMALGAVLS